MPGVAPDGAVERVDGRLVPLGPGQVPVHPEQVRTVRDVRGRQRRVGEPGVLAESGVEDGDDRPARGRAVSYTHLRAHETRHDLVCRLLLEKKKKNKTKT